MLFLPCSCFASAGAAFLPLVGVTASSAEQPQTHRSFVCFMRRADDDDDDGKSVVHIYTRLLFIFLLSCRLYVAPPCKDTQIGFCQFLQRAQRQNQQIKRDIYELGLVILKKLTCFQSR